MKKFFWLALLICFLAVFSFANEKKTGFYLKIYGSPIFSNGGDFNDMIDSNSDYLLNEGKSFSGTYDISVKHSPFFYGFGGEIGYDFGKFSIGIETGYELKNFKMNRTWFDGYKGKWYCTLSTIPILLNMNFKVINSPSIQACLIGGGGIHFGKYEENWNFRNISNKNLLYIGTEKSKEQQFGFFGGISIDFKISNKWALFVQSRYQFINFHNMMGTGHMYSDGVPAYMPSGPTDYNEGDLIFHTYPQFSRLYVGGFIPAISNTRKAKLNINGFSLTVGIKLNLFTLRRQ